MGELISLDSHRQRLEAKLSSKEKAEKAYSELQMSERALFGNQGGLSFLEMIADEAPVGHPEPAVISSMKNAAYVAGQDLAAERYTDFKRYQPKQYEDFLVKAMTYFRIHEPEQIDPVYRLVSVARDLFRHGYGLPRATDFESNQKYCSTITGKISYRFWTWRVNKRLKKLGFDVAERKYKGLISSSNSSPGYLSGPSSRESS